MSSEKCVLLILRKMGVGMAGFFLDTIRAGFLDICTGEIVL